MTKLVLDKSIKIMKFLCVYTYGLDQKLPFEMYHICCLFKMADIKFAWLYTRKAIPSSFPAHLELLASSTYNLAAQGAFQSTK